MKFLNIVLLLLLLPAMLQAQVVTIKGITTKINSGLQVKVNGDVSNATSSTLHADGTLTIAGNLSNAGITKGSGTLVYSGSLTQTGTVDPGNSPAIGKLTVTGNYNNGPGALNIDLGAATAPGSDYDQLAISGAATLSGTLNVNLVNSFSLSAGQSFTILTANTITGTFAATNLPSGVTVQYNATNVQLVSGPDLTPILYARPSTLYGPSDVTVVVDVVELVGVPTNGTLTVQVTKDPKVSLSYPPTATSINNRPVQNSMWSLNGANTNYYILTTTAPVPAGNKLSFGFTGVLSPGATTGMVTISAVIMGGSILEARVNNNTDADKLDYFQQ